MGACLEERPLTRPVVAQRVEEVRDLKDVPEHGDEEGFMVTWRPRACGSSTVPGRVASPGEVSYELRREAQADDGAISGLGSIAEHSNTAVSLAPRPSEVFKRERL